MTVLAWEKEVGTVAYGVGQFIQVNVRFVHFPRGCRKKMEYAAKRCVCPYIDGSKQTVHERKQKRFCAASAARGSHR